MRPTNRWREKYRRRDEWDRNRQATGKARNRTPEPQRLLPWIFPGGTVARNRGGIGCWGHLELPGRSAGLWKHEATREPWAGTVHWRVVEARSGSNRSRIACAAKARADEGMAQSEQAGKPDGLKRKIARIV